MEEAKSLAKHYQIDIRKAEIAGLLHDCAKYINEAEALQMIEASGIKIDDIQRRSPSLYHSLLGPVIAKEQYGVTDQEVLDAIFWHATGKAGMTPLEKIIFIADYIEPGRTFEDVDEARKAACVDINRCILICSDSTIRYLVGTGRLLHPYTIETRNYAILGMKSGITGL